EVTKRSVPKLLSLNPAAEANGASNTKTESVKVAVPIPATVTVGVPVGVGLKNDPAAFLATLAVSPVKEIVTRASVKGVPPREPVAVAISVYVIMPARPVPGRAQPHRQATAARNAKRFMMHPPRYGWIAAGGASPVARLDHLASENLGEM